MAHNEDVQTLINDPRRIGAMATTDRQGAPNVALIGSAHMPDEFTVVVGLGDNRTAQNLLETGHAVYLSMIPAENPIETQGARVYLKVRTIEKTGPQLDSVKRHIRERAGERAAARIQFAVFFDVESTRPLIDWSPQSKAPLT